MGFRVGDFRVIWVWLCKKCVHQLVWKASPICPYCFRDITGVIWDIPLEEWPKMKPQPLFRKLPTVLLVFKDRPAERRLVDKINKEFIAFIRDHQKAGRRSALVIMELKDVLSARFGSDFE